jgi:hypothetical protein
LASTIIIAGLAPFAMRAGLFVVKVLMYGAGPHFDPMHGDPQLAARSWLAVQMAVYALLLMSLALIAIAKSRVEIGGTKKALIAAALALVSLPAYVIFGFAGFVICGALGSLIFGGTKLL